MPEQSEDFGQMGQTCDECSPCWPHRGGYGRCPCDCHPADPAADLEHAMAVIDRLSDENERLRAELRRFQRIVIDASEALADCEDLCGVLCAGPCQGINSPVKGE